MILLYPIIIPLFFAIISLAFTGKVLTQKVLCVIGACCSFTAATVLLYHVNKYDSLVTHAGGWGAPHGITFIADRLSAIMVWMSSFIAFLGSIYGWTDINAGAHRRHFTALYFFLLMGVQGAYLTSDLLNMYVFFEILLCSSFVLLIINLEKPQMKGSLKYVILNLFSSTLFLIGAGLLYGKLGSLNLADMAMKLQVSDDSALILSSGILLLMAFGLKAGIFPLFFWLPVSYHNPPVTVSVIFSGLLTKVGIYAMLRLSTLIFESHYEDFKTIMLILAMATMVIGVMGAASQLTIRKILSFHIISQVGYIIAGIALMTMSGLAAAVYYIVHDIAAKANLFFISGMIHRRQGTDTLSKNGNLLALSPALSILFCNRSAPLPQVS